MRARLLTPLFTLIFISLATIACQKSAPHAKKSAKQIPVVAVSIPPYTSLVKAIAGDSVHVVSVIGEKQNPHLSQSTFKQVDSIDKASLWIGIGESYEPKILRVLKKTSPNMHILQMNKHFPLMRSEDDPLLPVSNSHGHGHAHSEMDPHFFLSPRFLSQEATLIKDALIAIVPSQEIVFQENFEKLNKKITHLNQKLHSQLGRVRGKGVLVSHSALGYFCYDFGLKQYALESHGKPLLPKTLDHILSHIPQDRILCAFTFIDHNNKALLEVANIMQVQTYEINPMAEDLLATIDKIGDDLDNSL
ncbi:hypothetical protein COB21_05555 [Candidatus Aerophobetes bacterium]|uniref:Zinc ABC transporter substrate-binding protein n=1 Tax=Aerophobetes bacterium TaxID=2030807 RepID=A0A2A4WZ74_UNCAE|nr:MAG: hypothetical protein COB21_05555 [Candidatus Aerophobetes bacterium]